MKLSRFRGPNCIIKSSLVDKIQHILFSANIQVDSTPSNELCGSSQTSTRSKTTYMYLYKFKHSTSTVLLAKDSYMYRFESTRSMALHHNSPSPSAWADLSGLSKLGLGGSHMWDSSGLVLMDPRVDMCGCGLTWSYLTLTTVPQLLYNHHIRLYTSHWT